MGESLVGLGVHTLHYITYHLSPNPYRYRTMVKNTSKKASGVAPESVIALNPNSAAASDGPSSSTQSRVVYIGCVVMQTESLHTLFLYCSYDLHA